MRGEEEALYYFQFVESLTINKYPFEVGKYRSDQAKTVVFCLLFKRKFAIEKFKLSLDLGREQLHNLSALLKH